MSNWEATPEKVWQGRDDSLEGPWARRLFQSITLEREFTPEKHPGKTALIGFECDEGISRNRGRTGAREAPDHIRRAMANLAAHLDHDKIVDLGNFPLRENHLERGQEIFADHILRCHTSGMKTAVLGGGHETAFAHGLGVYRAYPDQRIGIINFDAHLDIRATPQASSGTPFKQLADYCERTGREFRYLCLGANLSSNTQALLHVAEQLAVEIVWDTECQQANYEQIRARISRFADSVDVLYLTIDLDVLPSYVMAAVSAPATLGVPLPFLLALAEEIKKSGKMMAVDFVEYNPQLDANQLYVKVAARFAWQMCLGWHSMGEQKTALGMPALLP